MVHRQADDASEGLPVWSRHRVLQAVRQRYGLDCANMVSMMPA